MPFQNCQENEWLKRETYRPFVFKTACQGFNFELLTTAWTIILEWCHFRIFSAPTSPFTPRFIWARLRRRFGDRPVPKYTDGRITAAFSNIQRDKSSVNIGRLAIHTEQNVNTFSGFLAQYIRATTTNTNLLSGMNILRGKKSICSELIKFSHFREQINQKRKPTCSTLAHFSVQPPSC